MNINKNISKLLYALSIKNKVYKINSFKFYNENKNNYSTKYQIMKRKFVPILNEDMKIEYQEKYEQDYDCYSKIDLMKYLIREYQEGSEADGG